MGDEYTALAHSLNIRLQNAEAENARLAAEVERLQKRWEKAVHFVDFNADSLEDASATLHALAREDGDSDG